MSQNSQSGTGGSATLNLGGYGEYIALNGGESAETSNSNRAGGYGPVTQIMNALLR
jgi:hypothetical protein